MKQVLSVADFATILDLVNQRLFDMRMRAIGRLYPIGGKDREEAERKALDELNLNPQYLSLVHLKNSLESLNIEVECPDVEIKGE